MRNNKILGVAIAATLAGASHNALAQSCTVQPSIAGQITLCDFDKPPTVALELFPNTEGLLKSTNGFRVQYQPSKEIIVSFYAKFTLTSGGFKDDLASEALEVNGFTGPASTSVVPILVDGGAAGDKTATFLVPAKSEANSELRQTDTLDFKFKVVDSDEVLDGVGGNIGLDLEMPLAVNKDKEADSKPAAKTLVSSVEAADVDILQNDDPGETYIDVARGGKVFLNGVPADSSNQTARLGYLLINDLGKNSAKELDGQSPFNLSDIPGLTAEFEITNGIFSASDNDEKNVFLDLDDNGIYDGNDIKADTLKADQVLFTLDSTELHGDGSPGVATIIGNDKKVGIVVKVDGDREIKDHDDPALAVLTMNYGTQKKSYQKRLTHIKRNGTTCKFYNVPYTTAKDRGFYRFTNKTKVDGILKGTLRDQDGKIIGEFEDKDLLEGGVITPNATAVVSAEKIAEMVGEQWTGRATLQVVSNLTDMEALALLRNKDGGPLMNVSLGASGNSCD